MLTERSAVVLGADISISVIHQSLMRSGKWMVGRTPRGCGIKTKSLVQRKRNMSEMLVYEGRLCTVRRVGELLLMEPAKCDLLYTHDEMLSETQLIIAALLGDKG